MNTLLNVLVLFLLIECSVSLNLKVPTHLKPLSSELISAVNNLKTTWTAGKNFDGRSFEQVRGLLGGFKSTKKLNYRAQQPNRLQDLPTSFDAATNWPRCPSISVIRDQGSCGSCWAISTAEAITDRTCISTGTDSPISTLDIMSCCPDCGSGCDGGFHANAWQWWVDKGVVSGGLYDSGKGCQPYTIPSCEHHVNGTRKPCGDTLPTPACVKQCTKDYRVSYSKDKRRGKSSYQVGPSTEAVMFEILNNGPVTAQFDVYSDFLSYKSG